MRLGQFCASVSVDGVELAEYAPEYSADGTEGTCWIPSEEGKQFCIKWTDDQASAQRQISGRVAVDGICCGRKALKIRRGTHFSWASRDSVSTSDTTRRPLLFGTQALTDNDEYLNAPVSPDLGTIQVLLSHVRNQPTHAPLYKDAWQPQTLHERSKKAIGHTVHFGAEYQQTRSRRPYHAARVVKNLVTFVFKYRPIGLLRAQGIAPPEVREDRAVSPVDVLDLTLVNDDDEEDVVDVEIKKLEARLGALKKKKKRTIKSEHSEVKKEIKNEEPIFQPGEVIDLT